MRHPLVSTTAGKLRGRMEALGRFRGIPYAAPPVGDLRWRAPMPASSWNGVRDALEPGPAAMQFVVPPARDTTGMAAIPEPVSEDCPGRTRASPPQAARVRTP